MAESTDYKVAMRHAEKQAAKKRAQQEAKPIAESIDVGGKVKIFHLHDQKYMRVWPVDARGMLENGSATMSPIEVVGPAGRVMIDSSKLNEYLAKDYLTVEDYEVEFKAKEEAEAKAKAEAEAEAEAKAKAEKQQKKDAETVAKEDAADETKGEKSDSKEKTSTKKK